MAARFNARAGYKPGTAVRFRVVMSVFTALALVATVLMGVAFGGGSAGAQDSGLTVGSVAYVGTDILNLRAEASAAAEVVAVYSTGAAVTVVDGPVEADGYVWYAVEVDGLTGWMAGDYLAATAEGAAALYAAEFGINSATVGASAVSAGGYAAGAALAVNSDDVNFRAAAGLDADIIATLASGTVVTVVSGPERIDVYSWYQVIADGTTGYIAADYLGDASSVNAVALSALVPSFVTGSTVSVAADGLNLRAAAGLDGAVLDTLAAGETATVTGDLVSADGYTWYQVVDAAGIYGWVAGDYLAAA